jgi:type III secretory pathway component EscR
MKNKKKSGIVLLITLFFIFSISILILKNLQDHEQFLNESSLETTLIQMQMSSENIQNEVKSLVKKYKENIDEIINITSNGIPFDYGNIRLNIILDIYDVNRCDLNSIKFDQPFYEQCEQNIIDNISYQYDFIRLLKQYRNNYHKFSSQDQIDYFINDYKNKTKDENIDNIKNDFTFLKADENTTYLKCSYEMLLNSNTINGIFVFANDNNQSNKVFNLTIK